MSKISTIFYSNFTAITVACNSRLGVVSAFSLIGDNLDLLHTKTDLLLVILLKYATTTQAELEGSEYILSSVSDFLPTSILNQWLIEISLIWWISLNHCW